MGLMTLEEIKNQLKSEGKRVYIPLYQRNYRWPAEAKDDGISAGKLIKDIVSHMPENDFVLGMITIYKDHDGNIQVLDGQQRLITLSLIVKALNDGDIDENNWINLEFERDPGFSKSEGENSTPRHDFLLIKESDENSDHVDVNSVDVNRMRNNYVAIKKFIDDKEKEDIFRFMLEHIRLFLHETKREPIDEFLNINFNKTPFCAADYIKSYMILDAADDTDNKANSVQGHTENIPISVQDIMGLWRSMAYDLYQLNELTVEHSGSDENDMYMLIKDGYKQLEKSRMEILFEDYYYDNDNDKVKLVKEKYHAKDAETRLKNQYDELLRYHKLMQELLQELIVVDKDGNRHPNCTAYGAFRQLRKSKDLTFFSLFDNSNKTIQEGLYKEFNPEYKYNLEMRSYENINRDPQTVNRFMHAMLATTPGGGNEVEAEQCEGIDEEQRFNGYNKIFDDSFTAFIDIVERAKKCNAEEIVASNEPKAMEETITNPQPDQITEPVPLEKSFELEQKPYTLEELFTNDDIDQIKIPLIQRDYVMGGALDYLKKYLLRIRYEELISRLDALKVDDQIWYCFGKQRGVSGEKLKKLYKSVVLHDGLLKEKPEEWLDPFSSCLPREQDPSSEGIKNRYEQCYRYSESLIDDNDWNEIKNKIPDNNYKKIRENRNCLTNLGEWLFLYNIIARELKNIHENLHGSDVNIECSLKNIMNGSCIMGHLDEYGVFWVYDGQQRITTLVLMLLFAINKYGTDSDNCIRENLKKFSFEGRGGANKILEALINSADMDAEDLKGNIDDQSSYSMYRMWKFLNDHSEKETKLSKAIKVVHPQYIWSGMNFEVVSLDKVGDAEHMFIELNEGFKLGEAEQYKAQLCHWMNKNDYEKEKEISRKIDNKWLNHYCYKEEPEQEEVNYIQICVHFACFEVNGYDKGREPQLLGDIKQEVLNIAFKAMDTLVNKKKKVDDRISKLMKVSDSSFITWEQWWMILMDVADTSCFKPLTCGFKNNDNKDCLYFSFADFDRLIKLYEKFVPDEYKKIFFKHVYELRNNNYICISDETENAGGDTSTNPESISIAMLRSRMDGFRYYANAKRWEDDWDRTGYKYKIDRINKPFFLKNIDGNDTISSWGESYYYNVNSEEQYQQITLENVAKEKDDEERIYKYYYFILNNKNLTISISVSLRDENNTVRSLTPKTYHLQDWKVYAKKQRDSGDERYIRAYYKLRCDYAILSSDEIDMARTYFKGEEYEKKLICLQCIFNKNDKLNLDEGYLLELYNNCDSDKKRMVRSFIVGYCINKIDTEKRLQPQPVSFSFAACYATDSEYNDLTRRITVWYIQEHAKKAITYSEDYEKLIRGVLSQEEADKLLTALEGDKNVNS